MSRTVAEILDDALALPEADRAELADLITSSIGSPPRPLDPAWTEEARRRAAEVDSGVVSPLAWEAVRREARAMLEADGTLDD